MSVIDEFTVLLIAELYVGLETVGDIKEIHSGGLVVLLMTLGLDGRGCPGGLIVLDSALLCAFDPLNVGVIAGEID